MPAPASTLSRPFLLLGLLLPSALGGPASSGSTGSSGIQASRGDGPLKVFILAGQSNMQGHAQQRTLSVMGMDSGSRPMLEKLVDKDGQPRVIEDVWISSLGSASEIKTGQLTVGYGAEAGGPKLGPELAFGVTMQELLGEPILLIKTAWGGKSLHTDFRPPSAGPYEFNESELQQLEKQERDVEEARAERAARTGVYYRAMLDHVRSVLADVGTVVPGHDERRGYELAGFVWFQGWNDMVDRGVYPGRDRKGGYDAYSEVMGHFIRDLRSDLEAPGLPVVIGVLGVNGPVELYGSDQKRYAGIHQNFRDAMAAPASLAEFRGNVAAVLTELCWDQELTRVRAEERALKPEYEAIDAEQKAGRLSREEARARKQQLREEHFDERELELLANGASNAEYHYLGSAKILCGIGEDFAEALHPMLKRRRR